MHHAAAFLVLLLPGAYVMLDTDTLGVLGPLRTLRVGTHCQPSWHWCSCPRVVSALRGFCIATSLLAPRLP